MYGRMKVKDGWIGGWQSKRKGQLFFFVDGKRKRKRKKRERKETTEGKWDITPPWREKDEERRACAQKSKKAMRAILYCVVEERVP